MTEHIDPDENETAVRTMLRRLGVRPTGHAAADAEQRPAAVAAPPKPDYEPTVTVPGPRRVSASRLPEWWAVEKPALGAGAGPAAAAIRDDQPGEDPPSLVERDDSNDGPAEQPAQRRRMRLREVLKRSGRGREKDAGEERAAKRRRWRRSPRGASTRPPFATAVPLYKERERKSLGELIREIPAHKKWLLYIGSGFGAGWYVGIPQFIRDATASVAHHPGRLQDNPDVYFWGVVGLLVVSADRATRRSWFPFAWITRGLTACLVLGALLYGKDALK